MSEAERASEKFTTGREMGRQMIDFPCYSLPARFLQALSEEWSGSHLGNAGENL